MPFTQLGLPFPLVRNLLDQGYQTPTPIQAQAIPAVQVGRDLVATAQTGTGKTAAFLLPVMHQLLERNRGTIGALVLTPTRELANQVEQDFRRLAKGAPLRSALIVGGVSPYVQERALRTVTDLVVATPGRLLDLLNRGVVNMSAVRTLVLDEADQMFDMGFLPDVKRIISRLPAKRQTLLFSATMPPEIAELSRTILRNPERIEIGAVGAAADTVTQIAYPVPAHRKPALLMHLLEQWEMPSVIVFTRTKHGAKRLAGQLYDAGHGVAELHSDRNPNQRARAMQAFRSKIVPVMVATNIAARGLDVRHITHVVNFDVPNAPDEYVHRIGRAGRAGDKGDALVFVAPEENGLLTRIERQLRRQIPRHHAEDFDYHAAKPPKGNGGAKSARGESKSKSTERTTVKKKAYRGQGRR